MSQHPSRRAIVSGAAFTAAVAATAPSSHHAQQVRGLVFHDATSHDKQRLGAESPANAGIAGVLVSNGRDIVATDRAGRWELPWRPGYDVFVIKPQGWRFAQALPGRGQGWRTDVTPGAAVAFGLVPNPEPAIFDVALLADTQPQTDLELDYFRDTVLADVARSGASFAINHGDVVFDDLSLYDRYLRLISGTGMPWHHCPGNHDMNAPVAGNPDRFAVWKAKIGPTSYAFEYGHCTFILLNNVAPLAGGGLTTTGYDYRGFISADQLVFVRNLLARTPRDRLVVVSMHIPLVCADGPDDPASRTANCDALLGLLAERPRCVSFSGHTHTTEHHYLPLPGGGHHHHHVLTAASGSWWSGPFDHCGVPIARSRDGNPRGFHVLSVEGHRYTTRFAANAETNLQVGQFALCQRRPDDRSLIAEGRLVVDGRDLGGTDLVFNLYDGGPRSSVRLQLARHSPSETVVSIDMTREAIPCPSTVNHFARYRTAIKSWVEACSSTHMWSAPLPQSLTAGVYTATMSVRDEYGRGRSSSALLEIQET